MNVEKQILFWRDGSLRAWRSVPVLADGEFWAEALFWAHLSIEKALKAHVVKSTQTTPPYVHNLSRLAEIAGLSLIADQLAFLREMTVHQRIARYPDESFPEPDAARAGDLLRQAEVFRQWLLTTL